MPEPKRLDCGFLERVGAEKVNDDEHGLVEFGRLKIHKEKIPQFNGH